MSKMNHKEGNSALHVDIVDVGGKVNETLYDARRGTESCRVKDSFSRVITSLQIRVKLVHTTLEHLNLKILVVAFMTCESMARYFEIFTRYFGTYPTARPKYANPEELLLFVMEGLAL